MAEESGRRLLFLTHPRSASHLFIRILNVKAQKQLSTQEYYFFGAWMNLLYKSKLHLKPFGKWTSEELENVTNDFQASFDRLEADGSTAREQGKTFFVKEHSCFLLNPMNAAPQSNNNGLDEFTVKVPEKYASRTGTPFTHSPKNTTPLPDEYLKTYLPTFLIRHPALSFPSYFRVLKMPTETVGPQMTLKWTRALYEWWDEQLKEQEPGEQSHVMDASAVQWPILLDADDVIKTPAVIERWCSIAGADPSVLQYTWAPLSKEELAALPRPAQIMTQTLSGSAGVIAEGKTAQSLGLLGKGKDEALEKEIKEWKEEFGEDDAKTIEEWVKASMEDYEWLRERRLRA